MLLIKEAKKLKNAKENRKVVEEAIHTITSKGTKLSHSRIGEQTWEDKDDDKEQSYDREEQAHMLWHQIVYQKMLMMVAEPIDHIILKTVTEPINHITLNQSTKGIKDLWLIINSGLTSTLTSNPELLTRVHMVDEGIHINCNLRA